jgi:hypothetical protein
MKPTEDIHRLIKKLQVEPCAEMDRRIQDRITKALEKWEKTKRTYSADIKPSIGRIVMKTRIIKLAAAAALITVCSTSLILWRNTGSGIVLADVLARVEQVKAFRCKGSFNMSGQMAPGKPYQFETRSTFAMSQDYGYKLNIETPDPNGGQMPTTEFYVSPQKKTFTQIAHKAKRYVRVGLDDAEAKQYRKQFSRYNDPGTLLKDIMACEYEHLGRSTINSVDVVGFRTTDPNYRSPLRGPGFKDLQIDIKVWVDVKTRLPVQYEDLTSGHDQRGNPIDHRFVLHDFEWDVPVTSAEFEPPPVLDGYAVIDKLPGLNDENTAIQGLKRCVELFGDYLETVSDGAGALGVLLSAFEKSETSLALRLKEEIKGFTEEEKLNRVTDAGRPILRLIWFYIGLVQEKMDPAYYGKTVTPKDTDKVLLRWKLDDDHYRVIFGDLSVKTVSAEELAEFEKP